MNPIRFFHSLLLAAFFLTTAATLLYFSKESSTPSLVAQNVNEYLGPKKRTTGKSQTVRVQILVNDAPNPQGVQIESVTFHKKTLNLKPRDIYGFRGEASFELAPGTYKLKWTVQRDLRVWPRTISHEEEVIIDPRDLWIQIQITGETASIT